MTGLRRASRPGGRTRRRRPQGVQSSHRRAPERARFLPRPSPSGAAPGGTGRIIYRYDLDQLGTAAPSDKISYDKAPMDGILDMTSRWIRLCEPGSWNRFERLRRSFLWTRRTTPSSAPSTVSRPSGARRSWRLGCGGRDVKNHDRTGLTEEGLPQELIFVAQEESVFLPARAVE